MRLIPRFALRSVVLLPMIALAGSAVLAIVYFENCSNVSTKAAYLKERLLTLPDVTDVSGLGLMIGVTVAEGLDARQIANQCAESGF